MCFQSDPIHELLCKVVRNLQVTAEDRSKFKSVTEALFLHGVTICRFTSAPLLKTWAAEVREQSEYLLKQDEEAFFLEAPYGPDGPKGDPSQLPFLHLQFSSGHKVGTTGPGAWWGLSKDDWSSPGAETKKRLLQAIAWIFFQKSPSAEKSWTRFHSDWAILAFDIKNPKNPNVAPKTRLKSLYFFDSERMVFNRRTPDCLAPLDANRSWRIPDRRSVETPSANQIDPPCGPVTLAFTFGSQEEPQLAKKITYDSVRQQIQQQAEQFQLLAYIVEFPSVRGYARFKRRTWDVFENLLKSNPWGIHLRFRQVRVVITRSGSLG